PRPTRSPSIHEPPGAAEPFDRWSSELEPPEAPAPPPAAPPAPDEPPTVEPGDAEARAPGSSAGPPIRTSPAARGTIANRWSLADGYGRRTTPEIVAVRPSTIAELGMPEPARPMIGTRLPPTRRSACQ